MTTTEINRTDPVTGVMIDVSPDLRARVEDAAQLLEGEIGDLDPVSVTARWQYVDYPQTGLNVRLQLEFQNPSGALLVQFMPKEFFDLDRLRERLRRVVSDLHFLILEANRRALRQQLDRLSRLTPAES